MQHRKTYLLASRGRNSSRPWLVAAVGQRLLRYAAGVIVGLAMLPAWSSAATLKLDTSHSVVGFTVTHLLISEVDGRFTAFSGSTQWEGQTLKSVQARIEAESIDTSNRRRDNHLRSDDFFNADRFPHIIFQSTRIEALSEDRYRVHGKLTIRDVTRAVVLESRVTGRIEGGEKTRLGFAAKTSINRLDYGIKWSKRMDGGGLVVSNRVDIEIKGQLVGS